MTTIKHTIDPKNPPKATKADLARLDAIADDAICPSSYKMEHQSGLSFGGSGSLA